MEINWPLSKRYKIRCPDGTIRIVYKDINHAFPLYIPGWSGDLGAQLKALEKASADLSADIKASYETKIQGLLFNLNDRNHSLMMAFRSVYVVFTSDPCENSQFLGRQVEKLIEEQRHLSILNMQVQGIIELAKTHPERTDQIFALFKKVVAQLGGTLASEAAALEIKEARTIAKKWVGSHEQDS